MIVKSVKDLNKLYIEKKLENFILVHGNDKGKIKETEDYIKGLVNNLKELNLVEYTGNSINFEDIKNACETIPVMTDKKVVHIKSPSFLLDVIDSSSKAFLNNLLEYIKDIPSYTILLISNFDLIDKNNSILKMASNIGILVEYKVPSYGRDLSLWIENFLKENKKEISKSNLFYLTNEVSNTPASLESELQKLIDYTLDKKEIEKIDIDNIIHKTIESNIFKMVDNMFKGNAREALEILDALILQGEQYPKIMFMIIRQFRILYSIKLLSSEGKSPKDIMSTLKIQEFVYKNMLKIASSWDENDIKKVLEDALETDFNIKSGKINQELGLEMFMLRICK